MRVTLTVARDARGKLSVPYIGDDAVSALAALGKLPPTSEGIVIRNPRWLKRKSGVRAHVVEAPESAPVVIQSVLP